VEVLAGIIFKLGFQTENKLETEKDLQTGIILQTRKKLQTGKYLQTRFSREYGKLNHMLVTNKH